MRLATTMLDDEIKNTEVLLQLIKKIDGGLEGQQVETASGCG